METSHHYRHTRQWLAVWLAVLFFYKKNERNKKTKTKKKRAPSKELSKPVDRGVPAECRLMCVSLSFFFHHHKTGLLGGPEIVRLWQVHLTGNAEKICLAAVNHFISFWNSFSCFFFVILFLSLFWIVPVTSLPTWLLSFFSPLIPMRGGYKQKIDWNFEKAPSQRGKEKEKWRNKYTRQQFLCTYKATTTTSLLLPASRRSILSSPFFSPYVYETDEKMWRKKTKQVKILSLYL